MTKQELLMLRKVLGTSCFFYREERSFVFKQVHKKATNHMASAEEVAACLDIIDKELEAAGIPPWE